MCDECLEIQKSLSHEDENGNIWTKPLWINCTHNQPERSKREDSQRCEMRCSEHCGNTVRDK